MHPYRQGCGQSQLLWYHAFPGQLPQVFSQRYRTNKILTKIFIPCVRVYICTQGILSKAVCWDVLEEQLFVSKVGGDEKRRGIFQEILQLHRENSTSEKHGSPADYMTSQKSLFKGEPLSSAGFHTNSWELGKNESHSPEPQTNLLNRTWPLHRNRTSKSKKSLLHWETVEVMRCVLDVGTHLSYFPTPLSPETAIFIAAKDDLYVPRKHITDVRSTWPG